MRMLWYIQIRTRILHPCNGIFCFSPRVTLLWFKIRNCHERLEMRPVTWGKALDQNQYPSEKLAPNLTLERQQWGHILGAECKQDFCVKLCHRYQTEGKEDGFHT